MRQLCQNTGKSMFHKKTSHAFFSSSEQHALALKKDAFIQKHLYLFLTDPAQLFSDNKQPRMYEQEEPGYVLSLLKAYKAAWEKGINHQISHDLLRAIHANVVSHGHDRKVLPGRYKTNCNHFAIYSNSSPETRPTICRPNASKEGFQEFLSTWMREPAKAIHEVMVAFPSRLVETLLEKSFKLVVNDGQFKMSSAHDEVPGAGPCLVASYEPKTDDERMLYAIDNSGSKIELRSDAPDNFHVCLINSMPEYIVPDNTVVFHDMLIAKLDAIFASYNQAIREASSAEDKLIIIAKHVQLISQVHPFLDGNTRTCYVLLNRLLMEEGLDLCLLVDPNRFDCFSVRELVGFIKEGQKYAESLLLFNIVPAFEQDQYIKPLVDAKLHKGTVQGIALKEERNEEYSFFLKILKTAVDKMQLTGDSRQLDMAVSELKKRYKLIDLSEQSLERALRNAAANDHLDELEFMLDQFNINIDAQDSNPSSRKTALYLAAERGHKRMVTALTLRGAKSDIPAANGITAQDKINAIDGLVFYPKP